MTTIGMAIQTQQNSTSSRSRFQKAGDRILRNARTGAKAGAEIISDNLTTPDNNSRRNRQPTEQTPLTGDENALTASQTASAVGHRILEGAGISVATAAEGALAVVGGTIGALYGIGRTAGKGTCNILGGKRKNKDRDDLNDGAREGVRKEFSDAKARFSNLGRPLGT